MSPDPIRTERLELMLITPAEATAMHEGRRAPWFHDAYPREDDLDGASMNRAGDPWGSRHILFEGYAVGSIGFFGPPSAADDGVLETEVGYGLVAPARGRGLASEALRAMLAAATADRVRIRASVEPDNRLSLRVLAGCGFTELRGSDDEGHLVLARPLPDALPDALPDVPSA